MPPVRHYKFIAEFQCLGDKCEDTCCRGWGMQVDAPHLELYRREAPELLEAVTQGEAECVMRRDPATGYCVKFTGGLCGIHKERGARFLGDACHFYPRITRKFGDHALMSGALSCPEAARLALYGENPFTVEEIDAERLPGSMKDYLPPGVTAAEAEKILAAFLDLAGKENISPERAMAMIISVAQSLRHYPEARWAAGTGILMNAAAGGLTAPERDDMDPYHLLIFLAGLIHAAQKTERRLEETFAAMEKALRLSIDRATLETIRTVGTEDAARALAERWRKSAAAATAPVLRRWLQAQLAMASYPFAGFGRDLWERTVVIAVRFATVRLALMCHMRDDGSPPDRETSVRVIQSLSRFMDHLADPELSVRYYRQAGWDRESRLRALIGDS